ncbi:hypothetical protein BOTBODRAFT_189736 [Botryobasidium botryosum FD-172 SS1]|uniref:Uncharacterized protein n=1 Tax=Botryobasidium botryosum (strain FD-172 SS1) TaxID=930990 RepID=A0A067MI11_BOTB1|nr:hypothetical protein BOTBODRAFT_189736 [Botryobasidium botryosum FD-172 SS1]
MVEPTTVLSIILSAISYYNGADAPPLPATFRPMLLPVDYLKEVTTLPPSSSSLPDVNYFYEQREARPAANLPADSSWEVHRATSNHWLLYLFFPLFLLVSIHLVAIIDRYRSPRRYTPLAIASPPASALQSPPASPQDSLPTPYQIDLTSATEPEGFVGFVQAEENDDDSAVLGTHAEAEAGEESECTNDEVKMEEVIEVANIISIITSAPSAASASAPAPVPAPAAVGITVTLPDEFDDPAFSTDADTSMEEMLPAPATNALVLWAPQVTPAYASVDDALDTPTLDAWSSFESTDDSGMHFTSVPFEYQYQYEVLAYQGVDASGELPMAWVEWITCMHVYVASVEEDASVFSLYDTVIVFSDVWLVPLGGDYEGIIEEVSEASPAPMPTATPDCLKSMAPTPALGSVTIDLDNAVVTAPVHLEVGRLAEADVRREPEVVSATDVEVDTLLSSLPPFPAPIVASRVLGDVSSADAPSAPMDAPRAAEESTPAVIAALESVATSGGTMASRWASASSDADATAAPSKTTKDRRRRGKPSSSRAHTAQSQSKSPQSLAAATSVPGSSKVSDISNRPSQRPQERSTYPSQQSPSIASSSINKKCSASEDRDEPGAEAQRPAGSHAGKGNGSSAGGNGTQASRWAPRNRQNGVNAEVNLSDRRQPRGSPRERQHRDARGGNGTHGQATTKTDPESSAGVQNVNARGRGAWASDWATRGDENETAASESKPRRRNYRQRRQAKNVNGGW